MQDVACDTAFLPEFNSQIEFAFRTILLMPCLAKEAYLIG